MEAVTLLVAAILRLRSPTPVVLALRPHRAQRLPVRAPCAKTTSTPAVKCTAAAFLLVAAIRNLLSPTQAVQVPPKHPPSLPSRPVPFSARTTLTVVGIHSGRGASPVALDRQTRLIARLIALLMRRQQRHNGEIG